ncbi:MAG: A/G-specific adenine glycosylase, partial [Actinobacteria bacterium]|nr:A/G-specific adenine glycosylase [Actinomycetota bacterium]
RQARGRLMGALQSGPVAASAVAHAMQRDEVTAGRLLADLVREGLVVVDGQRVRLPG